MKFIKAMFTDRFSFVDLIIIGVFAVIVEHTGWTGLVYLIPFLILGGISTIHIQMKLGLRNK